MARHRRANQLLQQAPLSRHISLQEKPVRRSDCAYQAAELQL